MGNPFKAIFALVKAAAVNWVDDHAQSMGAALMQEITLDKGRGQQTNYNNYPVVRMHESPKIDIVLVPSTEKPGGIGEPATALVVPAIANAVAAATGKRVRQLPLTAQAIRQA